MTDTPYAKLIEPTEYYQLQTKGGQLTRVAKFKGGYPVPDAMQPPPNTLDMNGKPVPMKQYRLKEIVKIFVYEAEDE